MATKGMLLPAGNRQREKLEALVTTRMTDMEEHLLRTKARDLGQSTSAVMRSLALDFVAAPMCTARTPARNQRTRELAKELEFLWRTG